jgi:hypothetical protein
VQVFVGPEVKRENFSGGIVDGSHECDLPISAEPSELARVHEHHGPGSRLS